MPTDFNSDADPAEEPDAHGQAAMVLVESLIHGLIDSDTITVVAAVEIVDIAVEVQIGIEEAGDGCPISARKSVTLLEAISISLGHDLPCDGVAKDGSVGDDSPK